MLILSISKVCFILKFWDTCFSILNLVIILLCIIVGSILAYKINQQNQWIKSQIEHAIEGETVGINDQNIELYNETIDLYQTLVPLNQELHRLRMKTQNLTNENYNMNDVKVKKIIENERQRLARELHDSVSQQLLRKYDVICYKRNKIRGTA